MRSVVLTLLGLLGGGGLADPGGIHHCARPDHNSRRGADHRCCRLCSRNGGYRLARLAAKFGPEIGLRDLLDRFSYDCLWRAQARS
jgi:hypothetical protein